MNFSSILLSIIFHTGIFISLITFFNSELRQKNKIHHELVSFHFMETNNFEKQKESRTLSNKQFKTFLSKKDASIQNLIKKKQSTEMLPTKSQVIKEKNFELKKKDIKKVKSLVPQIIKKIDKNQSIIKDNIFNKKPYMSVIPDIKHYRSAKSNQKFYSCSKSQKSKRNKNIIKAHLVNKNVTISALLGYNSYNYNARYVSISNLLNNEKTFYKNKIHISQLLNMQTDNTIKCN